MNKLLTGLTISLAVLALAACNKPAAKPDKAPPAAEDASHSGDRDEGGDTSSGSSGSRDSDRDSSANDDGDRDSGADSDRSSSRDSDRDSDRSSDRDSDRDSDRGGDRDSASADTMSQWTVSSMSRALRATGATINRTGVDDAGNPLIEATAANGLRFTVFGMACDRSVSGADRPCVGAEFSAIYNMRSAQAVNAAIETIDYAAVSYFRDGTNLRVTRYIIFDYGISEQNLEVNLKVFTNIAKEIGGKI